MDGNLYINDTLVGTISLAANFPNAQEIYAVGALNTKGKATNLGVVRMYSMKIYQNDVLVGDFLPVKDSAGNIGIFNDVTQTFYGNSGTGSVSAGPDVITVTVTSIVITTFPIKVSYEYGEGLDTTGMVVTAMYDDGTSKEVTGYEVSGYSKTTVGNQTITVAYSGFTDTFNVTVAEPAPHTVTFVDWDGTIVLKTEQVNYGEAATAPEDPARDGYFFDSWDSAFTNVTRNITVTAVYVSWKLANGVLTVASSFDMDAPTSRSDYPWNGQRSDIKRVVLMEGVTSIGDSAFYYCTSLVNTTIPASVTSIGSSAFSYCTGLASITFLNKETTIYNSTSTIHSRVTIYGYIGSTAQAYAEKYNRTFMSLDTCTVTFVDWDGTVLLESSLYYGNSAEPPISPTREGYFFLGWDSDFSKITGNLTIIALYDLVAHLTISPSEIRLIQGDSARLILFIGPDGLVNQEVTWSNSDPLVASMDQDTGIVTGLNSGTAVITVTHVQQGITVICTVIVAAVNIMSDAYREAIRTNQRGPWDCQVTVGDTVIPKKDITSLKLNEMFFASDKVSIGSVVSSYVELEIRNTGLKFTNKSFHFKLGMQVADEFEYVHFGTFYVTDSEGGEEDETLTITAYDSIKKTERPYVTDLTYPSNVQAVAEEIAWQCGITLANTQFPDITISEKINADTCREALGVLAQLVGCNVMANRESKLEFRWFRASDIEIDASNRYYTFSRKDMDTYIKSVKMVNDNGIFTAQSNQAFDEEVNGLDISVINAYGCQEIVNQVLSNISLTYRAGTLDFLGDPSITVGDIITVVDKYGRSYSFPIMKNTMEYDGGVKNTMEAYTESEEEQEFTSSKKTAEEKLDKVVSSVADIESDLYGELDEETGEYAGGIVDMVMGTMDPETGEQTGGMLKCVSCTELPANPDSNTIYLIQGEVTVS